MPYLRFTRDKRGYETTSLVHSVRNRQGRVQQETLYWFRTPPNIKVGRLAFDDEVKRAIEASHPDIEFDWRTILQATPPPAAPPEEMRGRRTRKERPEARGRSRQAKPAPAERSAPAPPPAPMPAPDVADAASDEREEVATTPFSNSESAAAPAPIRVEPPAQTTPVVLSPAEQLPRLRARFAELRSRIAELGGDRVAELQKQAEPLDPDGWADPEAVQKGIEAFEPAIREIRAALGLRRRRRSRRGGRRRREGASPTGSSTPGTAVDEALSSKPSDGQPDTGSSDGTGDDGEDEFGDSDD